MSGRLIPFPIGGDDRHGTVHVMPREGGGFEVAHESASGNSWGGFVGPFDRGQDAMAAAYALNRDSYSGQCAISICDAARVDGLPVKFAMLQEDFSC